MTANILCGDALEKLRELPDESVQCCVASPPYWNLRDYGVTGQLGLESTPEAYIARMVEVFHEVRRVLCDDGTLWVNIGDSYSSGGRDSYDKTLISETSGLINRSAGIKRSTPENVKPKDLIGIPWMLAFALRNDGWYLRQDIIWSKPSCMPESVKDRCTRAHEYIFMFSKNRKYFYNADAIAEPFNYPDRKYNPDTSKQKCAKIGTRLQGGLHDGRTAYGNPEIGRNKRSVWTIGPDPFPEAHFATFPEELPTLCILAGSKEGDVILDPFAGAGTTGLAALKLGRSAILIDLNPKYIEMIHRRIYSEIPLLYSEAIQP